MTINCDYIIESWSHKSYLRLHNENKLWRYTWVRKPENATRMSKRDAVALQEAGAWKWRRVKVTNITVSI